MSCANTADHSLVVVPSTRIPLRWPGFIVVIYDAFRESLEMQSIAHKRRRLNDE